MEKKWNREDFGAKTFRSDISWKKDSTARLTCSFYLVSRTNKLGTRLPEYFTHCVKRSAVSSGWRETHSAYKTA
ncbi:hypothetical protein GOBAR_DD00190 [Gossypium barbadense]|nr:hypothetical protein GOBAR_DD00190 [Gossypium barbadense]